MHSSVRLLVSVTKSKELSFYYRCVHFFPHPMKIATGGEDAFLSLLKVQAVFDGVSWWKEHMAVDAGLYSAALARSMHDHLEDDLMGEIPSSSRHLLEHAYRSCKNDEIEGTSTALLVTLQPPKDGEVETAYSNSILDVCSVGDCTALVVRGGRILFQSEEQTHDLDFPYQLGKGSSDTPARSLNYRWPVERGDLVLLGTDGLFDNLYPERVAEVMWSHLQKALVTYFDERTRPVLDVVGRIHLYEDVMHAIAEGSEEVMREARMVAQDRHSDTPYAHKAIEGGAFYEGGKQDDITFLSSVIGEEIDTYSGERFIRSAVMNPHPYRDWP